MLFSRSEIVTYTKWKNCEVTDTHKFHTTICWDVLLGAPIDHHLPFSLSRTTEIRTGHMPVSSYLTKLNLIIIEREEWILRIKLQIYVKLYKTMA